MKAVFILAISFLVSFARAGEVPVPDSVLISKMLMNVSPAGLSPGVVIASPSRSNPNYYYHWTRDAALVGQVMVRLYRESSGEAKSWYGDRIDEMIAFNRRTQLTPNYSGSAENYFQGYGEPRFNVNGALDTDQQWCRPQNDGPALRALMAIEYVETLLAEGNTAKAQSIYHHDPSISYLKSDLEFISHHWPDVHCSLWEDAYGHFFYTGLVQRRALLRGASLAEKMADPLAAVFYRAQASNLERELEHHWFPEGGYIVNNLNPQGGLGDRVSNLDTSVILAVNHAAGDDLVFGPIDDRVLATALKIKRVFEQLYPINSVKVNGRGEKLGTAVGRYPEDIYDGHGLSGGNPWFLLVHAMAEFHYRAAAELQHTGRLEITSANLAFLQDLTGRRETLRVGDILRAQDQLFAVVVSAFLERGDSYLRRSLFHASADGSMREQFRRDSGYEQGVPDLTWGYASLLTARWSKSDQFRALSIIR